MTLLRSISILCGTDNIPRNITISSHPNEGNTMDVCSWASQYFLLRAKARCPLLWGAPLLLKPKVKLMQLYYNILIFWINFDPKITSEVSNLFRDTHLRWINHKLMEIMFLINKPPLPRYVTMVGPTKYAKRTIKKTMCLVWNSWERSWTRTTCWILFWTLWDRGN